MPVCSFCDHSNSAGRRHCEKCGAELVPGDKVDVPVAGRPLTAAVEAEIAKLLQNRQKIEAIKRYREVTGVGLREAKEAIEQWEVNLGLPIAPRAGCAAVLLLVVFLAGSAALLTESVRPAPEGSTPIAGPAPATRQPGIAGL